MNSYIEQARKVLEIEALAVKKQIDGLGEEFNRACEIIQNCKGHLIVTGLGKSGHIGAKIAATFASTGTPSFFVHPTEAGHGDIGMITADDCVLGLSYSGSAREILTMFNVVKKMGVKTIAVTGGENSPMSICISKSKKKLVLCSLHRLLLQPQLWLSAMRWRFL